MKRRKSPVVMVPGVSHFELVDSNGHSMPWSRGLRDLLTDVDGVQL